MAAVLPASISGKLQGFFHKGRRDQIMAIRATVRYCYRAGARRVTTWPVRRLLAGRLAVPRVLSSRGRLYVAYRPDWDVDFGRHPELAYLAANWVANNLENNAGDLPRLYALLLNINQVMMDGVPGDFAEVGVYRGNSAAVLAHYVRNYGRTLYLFDTYDGFEAKDLVGIDTGKPLVFADTSLKLVQQNVGDDAVVFVKGHFPVSVPNAMAAQCFAVVHLDCDLYEPMKAGLAFFFHRLSPGGLMIIHDYANPSWDGARQAVDEFMPLIAERLILIPDKSGSAMIRKFH